MSFKFEPARQAFNFFPNTNFDLIYKHTTSHFERLNSTNVNNAIFLFFQFLFLIIYIISFIFSKFISIILYIVFFSIRFFKFCFIPLQYGYNTFIMLKITYCTYIMFMYVCLLVFFFVVLFFFLFSDCASHHYMGLIQGISHYIGSFFLYIIIHNG